MDSGVEERAMGDDKNPDDKNPAEPVSCFPESDYRFGAGPLWIRVKRVDWQRPVSYDGDAWYEIDGIEVTEDGRYMGRRQALVRGPALAVLRRNAGPRG
jgi:hypothetical protein